MIITPANRLKTVKEYYFSRKLKEIRQMRAEGRPVINAGIGSPDLTPAPAVQKAMAEIAQQNGVHGYQSYVGIPELRQAMTAWYARTYDVSLDANKEILPLIGSKEGIMHLSMAFLNEGDGVLVPNPGYPTYSSVARLVGANLMPYKLQENNNWQVDLEALEQMDLSKVKLMWVNYPNMPTGADADYTFFEKLIAFAHKHQILAVNDNPYSLILNDSPKSILTVDGAKEVAMELNSLSKSHNMAGWRVGMLCGGADYIGEVLKVKSNMDSGMFLGTQKAAIAALSTPISWHNAQNDIYAKRKKVAHKILKQLGCSISENQVGMFVWGKVANDIPDVETWINDLLYRCNVFITPGFIFGSAGERYIRISLCSNVETLQEVLRRISVQ